MQCLVLAAGLGSRLEGLGPSKPLVPLAGSPLLGHVLDAMQDAGCTRAVVVTGHQADEVEAYLARYAKHSRLAIETIRNRRFREPNGLSVTAARPLVAGQYILSMCDHVFDPGIARDLMAVAAPPDEAVLAIDRRLDNPDVDLEDVTRVQAEGEQIRDIGKGLATYNAFDTGLFLAGAGLMNAIEAAAAAGEPPSISAGMLRLAADGKARAFDIGNRFWIDVDSPQMLARAEAHQHRI